MGLSDTCNSTRKLGQAMVRLVRQGVCRATSHTMALPGSRVLPSLPSHHQQPSAHPPPASAAPAHPCAGAGQRTAPPPAVKWALTSVYQTQTPSGMPRLGHLPGKLLSYLMCPLLTAAEDRGPCQLAAVSLTHLQVQVQYCLAWPWVQHVINGGTQDGVHILEH